MKRPLAQPSAAYDSHTLKLLGRAYDDAWKAIAGNYGSPSAVEAARQKLATIILGLAPSDGIRDVELIKYRALVAMRRKESTPQSLKQARTDVANESRPFSWDDRRGLVRG
jgi:hypothetical protein